ncbi:hypothetical protein [Agrobacterium sp. SORGH_AS 787]|uniref:hypothetical protein n=1 Tax=Agrobacterium sp. SORGH_AS 787 TaxID=3041775 RepID=UPI0032B85A17
MTISPTNEIKLATARFRMKLSMESSKKPVQRRHIAAHCANEMAALAAISG